MNPAHREKKRRPGMKRAVVLLPNGFTLFNLCCGIYAIILAIRGDFAAAPAFIVLGGVADALDGRVARATGTGSRFGEELDSLVDAISFGFAPALIMYLELPNRGTWEWLLVFIFTSCAVMRLARFNVEQAGRKKTNFHGLPSPAAGLTLATYYWFSQTPLYNQAVILFTDSKTLADLPWHTILRGLMAMLAALMISDVPYPAVPSVGFKSLKKILGSLVVGGSLVLLLVRRKEFIFPALLAYVLFGAIKWAVLGFIGKSQSPGEVFWDEPAGRDSSHERRVPIGRTPSSAVAVPAIAAAGASNSRDDDDDDDEDDDDNDDDEPEVPKSAPPRRKRRRRGGRGGSRQHGTNPLGPTLPDSPTGPAE
ncbi:MAG: CDP-diacylglycerol--serine O-phosphatidyltransferase [Gemmatimonadaceae bacterium]